MVNSDSVARIGLHSGSTILISTFTSLAPSISAASSMDCGRPFM